MRYEGAIFRPPSEANSYLIRVIRGCDWNKCKFCRMYKSIKFQIRRKEEILKDIDNIHRFFPKSHTAFLGDSNPLIHPQIHEIIEYLKKKYPEIDRITAYARAKTIANMPSEKLKTLRETKISCALKNIYGCIAYPRKLIYHPILNEAIVGINKLLRPHLTIVDGIVALGRYPIKLGLIIASKDPFSVDWVASKIMGFNPSKIKFLKIAMKEGLGDRRNIEIRGEDLAAFKKLFPKESFFWSKRWWNVQLTILNLYAKLVGDIVPPMLEKEKVKAR